MLRISFMKLSSRAASDDCQRFYVSHNDGPCLNYCAFPDSDAGKNGYTFANPYVISNIYRFNNVRGVVWESRA